jgi:hypothetical protein
MGMVSFQFILTWKSMWSGPPARSLRLEERGQRLLAMPCLMGI